MKKLIRIVSAVLAGVLVFFSASVIAAIIPKGVAASSEIAQMSILIPNNRIARSSNVEAYGQSRGAMPVLAESNAAAISSEQSETTVLADISHTQDIYQNIEEDTYDHIYDAQYTINSEAIKNYSDREKILIARVVYSEARGELFEGQVAVATVVLNRYENGRFGSSISRVVFAPNQFAITEKYNAKMLLAVEAAITQKGDYPDNMFFFQASTRKTWRNFVYYTRIGGHTFFCSAK